LHDANVQIVILAVYLIATLTTFTSGILNIPRVLLNVYWHLSACTKGVSSLHSQISWWIKKVPGPMSDFVHGWSHYFSLQWMGNIQHPACKKLAFSSYSCYLKGSLSVGLNLIRTNPGR